HIAHLAGDTVLGGADHHHDGMKGSLDEFLFGAGIGRDGAEKGHPLAIEAGGDFHIVVGDLRHQPLGLGRNGKSQQQRQQRQQPAHRPPPSTAMEKTSPGGSTSVSPKRMATASTSMASRPRNCAPRRYFPAEAPNWAPAVPPTIRQKASMMSTLWLCTACRMVVAAIIATTWASEVPITTLPGTRSR